MDNRLQYFIDWLQNNVTHFAALVTEGSVATNDPIQPGYSDNDLQIVVYDDVMHEMQAVKEWLTANPLGDTYLLSPRLYSEYIHGDSLNDLSLKFRSKVLAGRDVVAEKALPNQDIAQQIGRDGLLALVKRLERRWLNLAHWSDDHARHKNYEIYKNFFVFYAAFHYGTTGSYPKSRAEAAACMPDEQLAKNILNVTNNIANVTKEQQNTAIVSAIAVTQQIIEL